MFLAEKGEFPSAPCLSGGGGRIDDSPRLDVVEIARILTCFRARFLPGRAKDPSAPRQKVTQSGNLRTVKPAR